MLKFDRQGLIPAAIQDDSTGELLMLAFMNEEALQRTRETGYTHFFSRSRNTIWHKGEQSGNVQEVRDIRVNCEENSLLIRVVQHGGAACHTGYRSCYYRRLLSDGTYETIGERVFDPEVVYAHSHEIAPSLEGKMRRLYETYLYLRDHDLTGESNTSRLLHKPDTGYLLARLADELQELAGVQSGQHTHTGRQPDTILESSQVGYWLFLLAATKSLSYDAFMPHTSILRGYNELSRTTQTKPSEQSQTPIPPLEDWIAQSKNCLHLCASSESDDLTSVVKGLQLGFVLIGWACALAGVSPLAPTELDLEQMQRKGLLRD